MTSLKTYLQKLKSVLLRHLNLHVVVSTVITAGQKRLKQMASNLSNIDQIQQLEADEIQKLYRDELGTMLAHRMDDLIMQSMGAEPTNKRLLRKYNELRKNDSYNSGQVS